MRYNPNSCHRRSTRLKGYDYTQPGAYFVTLCTHERALLFGEVVDGMMVLNPYGEIVRDEWFKTTAVRPNVRLEETEFVVMPNHIHGIIWITDDVMVGATRRVAPTTGRVATTMTPRGPVPQSIGAIIGQFKSAVTKRIHALPNAGAIPIWQRNYYKTSSATNEP
ncbi:hypothetical protein HRbin30_00092 [bacterium HR30]|nr:hypothetical protein HRbin30_00092 [bacterium HR30]